MSAHNALIKLDEADSAGKGRKFKSRFITPGLAGYPDQFGNVLIQKETFDKFINSMVGVPVVIRHKDLTKNNADDERVGVVSTVWFDEKDGWYWCEGIIWDETAINLITDKGWSVSCSYDVLEADDTGGTWNNTPYDMEFLNGVFTHLALVDNPRYEKANIVFNSKTILNNKFKEEEHPRDEDGKFTSGGKGIKSFKDQIRDIESGNISDKTLLNVLDKPSQVWKDSGLPDKPLVMSAGVYKKATETKHQVDKETIEKLPELIQDPLYIFKSSTQQGSFVGVLNAVENKEKADGPLIVAIKPSQKGLEVNIVTSTYGKDKNFIERELNKGNLLYENKKTGVSNRKASIALKVNNLSENIITNSVQNFNPDMNKYEVANDKWITIRPNGEEKKGRPLLIKGNETPQEAIERVYGKGKLKKESASEDKISSLLEKGYEPMHYDMDLHIGKPSYSLQQPGKEAGGINITEDEYKKASELFSERKKQEKNKELAKAKTELKPLNDYLKKYYDGADAEPYIIKHFGKTYLDWQKIDKKTASALKRLERDEAIELIDDGGLGWRMEVKVKDKFKTLNNSKGKEMTLIDELKKLIQKVENDKGDCMKKANNEDVDKREILREADAIAMKPASDFKGGEEEKFRTLTKKLEELSYNKSERGTSDNEKEDDDDTKADNESEKDEEEYEDFKQEIKEDVKNKKSCKNTANNSKRSYFDELNNVYNAPQKTLDESLYVSRDEKLKAAEEYFS